MKLAKWAAMAFTLLVSTSAWATAEKVVEVAQKASPDLMARVGEYMTKMYDAALPIAKKAWEIGLMTLQIDAAGKFLIATALTVTTCVVLFKLNRHKKQCEDKAQEVFKAQLETYEKGKKDYYARVPEYETWYLYSPFDNIGYVLTRVLAFVPLTLSLFTWLDIWDWAKLFAPELWLAHEAIEKLMQ